MDILSDFGDSKKINNFYPSIQLQNNYFECNNHSTEIIEGPEIKYILNKQGFRSQDFDNFNKDNYNILVAGDSFTYGDGLPYDCTWHQILKNNFFKKNVEVFNLGFSATSIRETVKNVSAFIRKYGNPDYIIILMPPENRNIIFDEEKKVFTKGMREVNWLSEYSGRISKKSKIRYYKGYNEEESYLLGIDLIHMIEDVCASKNINLIWSTHEPNNELVYEKINFNNFMKIDYSNKGKLIKGINMPYWDIAKDNAHPGSEWHYFFASILYKKIMG